MRPRSRTLTSVHENILEDLIYPSVSLGKSTRVRLDGTRHIKVMLDPLDRDSMEKKLDAMSAIYFKLTTKVANFDFAKPTSVQKILIEKKEADKN